MGKDPEQEIQKKLVELELSIKAEEAKKLPSAAANTRASQLTTDSLSLQNKAETQLNAEIMHLGGMALMGIGVFLLFSHITLTIGGLGGFGLFSAPSIGLVIVPLLVGIGMLFYNYKSRVAQAVTAISGLAVIITFLLSLRMTFFPLSLIDFILMGLPVCAGAAMMTKAHVKRLELKETQEKS